MKTLNEENFEAEVLKAELPQVVMFHREQGCQNCARMRPAFEAFAAQAGEGVQCGLYACGQKPDGVTTKYPFKLFPAFYYFLNGQVVGLLEGVFAPDILALPLASEDQIKAAGFDNAELAGAFERAREARFLFEACKRTLALRANAANAQAQAAPAAPAATPKGAKGKQV